MPTRPTLEEVDDDIDNMEMDIAQFDPNLRTPIAPLIPPPLVVRSQDAVPTPAGTSPAQSSLGHQASNHNDVVDPSTFTDEERRQIQAFLIIYPCYFDANRSHKEGRRVSYNRAVFNPLAKTLSDACRKLNIPVLLELSKCHPQDYGNPGRVRVMLKSDGEKHPLFSNKRVLLNAIADYLKDHPTTLALIGPESGIALPAEYGPDYVPSEIPEMPGFRSNTIVPIHSNFTMKHPMTKLLYDPEPEEVAQPKVNPPKAPKKKIMKIRG